MRIRDENRYVDTSQSSFRRRYRTPRFLNFRSLILVGLFAPMLAGWAIIITNQINGTYFKEKYPKCNKTNAFDDAKKHFGHGKCYGGALNSLECDFEQSDCVMFNIAYPLCKGRDDLINVQADVGNGICNMSFAIPECDYDGGDCCPYHISESPKFGDGQCHGDISITEECGRDNGDCNNFHGAYPECPYRNSEKSSFFGGCSAW